MRPIHYTLLSLLLSVVCLQQAQAQDENKLSVPDITGMESSVISLPIHLDNTATNITGLQFDLTVPSEVMTLRSAEVTLSERKADHAVIMSSLGNGTYRLMVYSPTSSTLKGSSGELLTIGAEIASNVDKSQAFPIQLSRVSIGDTSGKNVATGSVDGTFRCLSCPDFTVSDIQWNKSVLAPGDTLEVSWKVSNIGKAASKGGWSEHITLIDASGAERFLGTCYNSDATLNAGASASRTARVALPLLLGLEGNADIKIELLPNSDSGEGSAYRANNTSQTTSHGIQLSKTISLTLPKTSLTEGEQNSLRCKILRSGHTNEMQTVTLSMPSGDSRVTFPSTVDFPQGQSTVFFDITLNDNDLLDDDSTFVIQASVSGYDAVQQTLLMADDELRHLTLTVSQSALSEGDFFTLTVKTEKAMPEPITVKLVAEQPERLLMPETVTIAAHATQEEVAIQVVDNETIELPTSLSIKGMADKHHPGECLITVDDNDMPAIDLELSASTVSENAAQPAVIAMLRRTTLTDREATILLSSSSDDILLSTSKITMKAGDTEKQFTINVKDNNQTDGSRQADVIAAVSVSSCNCSAEVGTVGSVTKTLDITDDDGPTLQIASSRASLVEGSGESATLTISRNTATSKSLTVTLSSDHDAAVTYPHTVTIPADATSAEATITLKDDATTGAKSIAFTAEAANHAKGSCWIAIAETPYPVAVVKNIAISSSEVTSGGDVEVTLTVANVGTADLPENTKIEFYVDGKKQLYTLLTNQVLAPGEEVTMTETLFLPESVGEHQITFKVEDSEGTGESASATWTVGNSPSAPVTLTTTSPFTVNISPDKATYHQEDVVTLSGQLQGEKTARTDVQITLCNDDARQQLTATTDAEGRFSTTYQLRSLQAGHFTVSAGYPGEDVSEEMASFDVYGLTAEAPENIELVLPETYTGSIKVSNPGDMEQTNVRVEMLSESGTCDFSFSTLSSISAGATAELPFTITTKELSEGNEWQKMSIAIISDEGAIARRAIRYYVQCKTGKLKSSTAYIDATMNVHTAKEYPVVVKNIGKGETGKISLSLPSWVTSTTPKEMASIAPGDSATVLLKFNPTSEMQLNVAVMGQIGLLCTNGEGTAIPFRLTPVSELKGSLALDAVDELTFYTEEAPHLSNATVKVIHPATKQVVASGTTDANGLFSVEIDEGWYNLRVETEGHDPYTDNIVINAGKELKMQVPLKSNAISYDFDVEEIELEDGYKIDVKVVSETSAPIPVVDIWWDKQWHEPGDIFPVVVTNKGFFSAYDIEVSMAPQPGTKYIFLDAPRCDELKGKTSVEYLVKVVEDEGENEANHAPRKVNTNVLYLLESECYIWGAAVKYNVVCCNRKEEHYKIEYFTLGNCNNQSATAIIISDGIFDGIGSTDYIIGATSECGWESKNDEPEEVDCGEDLNFVFKLKSATFNDELKGVACDGVSKVKIVLDEGAIIPKDDCNYTYEWGLYDDENGNEPLNLENWKIENDHTLDNFMFTTPEDYPWKNDFYMHSIYAILKYTNEDGEEQSATPIPIVISRVPVILIHGLNSSEEVWGDVKRKLYPYYLGQLLYTLDYSRTHNDSFFDNRMIVLNKVTNVLNYLSMDPNIEIECAKVDIVAHSMGGLLTKQDIMYYGLGGLIHKFITINTPHGGSQLGNFLTDPRVKNIGITDIDLGFNSFENKVKSVGFIALKALPILFGPSKGDIMSGAVADLSVGGQAIRHINKSFSGVKCHAIATYTEGKTDSYSERIGFPAIACFFGFSSMKMMLHELFNTDVNDCIVPFKSQQGGLPSQSLTLHRGDGSFAHTSSCHNATIIQDVLNLLLKEDLNSDKFADGFKQVGSLEYNTPHLDDWFDRHGYSKSSIPSNAKMMKVRRMPTNFKLNYTYTPGDTLINVSVTHDDNVTDVIIACLYQDSFVSFIEGDNGTITLPQKILDDVVLLYNGRDEEGSWICAADTVSVNTIGSSTISKLSFTADSLLIINDEYVSPHVQCTWSDGVVTDFEDAILFVVDEDMAYVDNNRWVYGKKAGLTELRATYQGLSCSIPLNVAVCKRNNKDDEDDDHSDANEVCNVITLQISQEAVMTRQAFRARFTLNNGHQTSSLKNFKLNIEIHDQEGNLVTPHEFQVNLDSLVNFQGEKQLNSAWTLQPKESGKAIMTLIPTKYAAPSLPVTYSIGGSFSYTDPFSGLLVTREIASVDILVNPAPDLDLTYFVQRDVFGDDPLTDNVVEPTKPAEFALIIHNKGNGNAKNVQFATAQPEIVENEKGLVVNYSIVSSQLNGQEATLALGGTVNTDFGTIASHSKTYAQWWMESTLLGHFLDYDVTATHLNSYGNEDLSLLGDVSIHELIHGFTVNSQATPPTRAFLVNDIPDNTDTPDMLYFTDDQEEETVSVTSDVTMTRNSDTEYIVTVSPSARGWIYGKVSDLTAGRQQLVSIVRQSDGKEMPVDNFWQTDRTLRDGKKPLYENMLHFIVNLSATSEQYLLTFAPKPDLELAVEAYEGVPEEGVNADAPIEALQVKFNKPIDETSFTTEDIKLFYNGTALDASVIGISKVDAQTFSLSLGSTTAQDGLYVLIVQTADITDAEGFAGAVGKEVSWVQVYKPSPDSPIAFADKDVKLLCVENWDTNGDGELSYAEAAAVTELKGVFTNKANISSFDEFKYFTGVTKIDDKDFFCCHNLRTIVIPSSVTSIGANAFCNCDDHLTSLVIPSSVTTIAKLAFANCKSLTSIVIPASVTSIGQHALVGCVSLESIRVEEGNPNYDSRGNCNAIIETATNTLISGCKETVILPSVHHIGDEAFYGMTGLTSITIPSTVKTIGTLAFSICRNLEKIEILEGVEEIGYAAFNACKKLTSIHIPASVTKIQNNPVYCDNNLVSITVDKNNATYDSRDYCNAIIETATNTLVAGCKTTVIPESITKIGYDAFHLLDSLTSIDIPNNVEEIDQFAFSYSGLKHVILPASVTKIRPAAFEVCRNLTQVELPAAISSIDGRVFNGCSNLTTVVVKKESPIDINEDVFSNRANATLYVPKGSKSAYQEANVWKDFKQIMELEPGDANGDGKVTIADVTATINFILDTEGGRFVYSNADINQDRIITTDDVKAIVKMILGK